MAAYFIHQNISDQQKFKQKEQPKQLYTVILTITFYFLKQSNEQNFQRCFFKIVKS